MLIRHETLSALMRSAQDLYPDEGCGLLIGVAEALHYVPGLEAFNAFGFDHLALQLSLLLGGAMAYILLTAFSYKRACATFEKIDL